MRTVESNFKPCAIPTCVPLLACPAVLSDAAGKPTLIRRLTVDHYTNPMSTTDRSQKVICLVTVELVFDGACFRQRSGTSIVRRSATQRG